MATHCESVNALLREEMEEVRLKLAIQAAEFDNLTRPDGSSVFSQGNTTVQAAVYGPTQARYHKAYVDRASLETVYKTKIKPKGCSERYIERILRNTLEAAIILSSFPRTTISIIVQELQDQGSLLSCCINAACLALIDSAIPMNFLVAAVNVALMKDGEMILNPTAKQEKSAKANLTFAFESVGCEILTTNTYGCFTEEEFKKCVEACHSASTQVISFYRNMVSQRFSKEVSSDMKQEVFQVCQTFKKNFNMSNVENEESAE